jgi:hypothetical protein
MTYSQGSKDWHFKGGIILGHLELRTYDTFQTFSLEKFFQPPPFEEFFRDQFSIFYGINLVIIISLVVYTPDCQRRGPRFVPRRAHGVYSYIFAITKH